MQERCLKLMFELLDGGQHWYAPLSRPHAELLLAAGYLSMHDTPRAGLDGNSDQGFVAGITPTGRAALVTLPSLRIEEFSASLEAAAATRAGLELPAEVA